MPNDFKFYALLNRLKYINRWSLMRTSQEENVAEHSYFTSVLAHSLCVIQNTMFGGELNADRAAAIALYHETAEALTGDLPTPIKYYNSLITSAYKDIERVAEQKALSALPKILADQMASYVSPNDCLEKQYVKYADKLAALIKCIEETSCGNTEFSSAEKTITQKLNSYNNEAVNYFLQNFLSAYKQTLDELNI